MCEQVFQIWDKATCFGEEEEKKIDFHIVACVI